MSHRNMIAKFLLAFVLAFAVIVPFQPQEAEAAGPISVYVNGQRLAKTGEAVNGSTLVPMRAIFEALPFNITAKSAGFPLMTQKPTRLCP